MNYEKACKVLEIDEKIDHAIKDIKRQYKIMALTYHPDKNFCEIPGNSRSLRIFNDAES